MQKLLLVASGFLLCLIFGIGIYAYQMASHSLGAFTNQDYPLIRIMSSEGKQYELRKGDAQLLPYGEYKVTIPGSDAAFDLFKNNRGTCIVRSINGVLVLQVNENASIQ